MKKLIALSATGASLLAASTCRTARAEGSHISNRGVHGVIRIVRSKPMSTQGVTRGHDVSTSGHLDASFYQPTNVLGHFDAEVDPLNNKPQLYLGGAAAVTDGGGGEFEGGLTFETGAFGGYRTGWSAFIARAGAAAGSGNVTVNPKLWRQTGATPAAGTELNDWRGSDWNGEWSNFSQWNTVQDPQGGGYKGSVGSIGANMSFTIVHGGGCKMRIDGVGDTRGNQTFFFNPNANRRGTTTDIRVFAGPERNGAANPPLHWVAPWDTDPSNSNDQRTASVKHEVAQTRGTTEAMLGGNFRLDGSWVRGTWSGCAINGRLWGTTATNQILTGFNAPSSNSTTAEPNNLAWDKRVNGLKTAPSHTIVEFTTSAVDPVGGLTVNNLRARQGTNSAADLPGDPARYTRETTIINLGTATRPIGKAVEWPSP